MTLKQARDLVKLSQRQLDIRAGLGRGTVHDLESGRTTEPSWTVVSKIIDALHAAGLRGLEHRDLFPVHEKQESR